MNYTTAPKKLILFLIYADLYDHDTPKGDLKTMRELDALYRDFRFCTLQDNCPIYIIHNSIRYKTGKRDDKTFVHKIVKGKDGNSPNKVKNVAEFNLPNAIQRQEQLQYLFKFIDKLETPDQIFLTTWDHGSVFGFFKEMPHPNPTSYFSIKSKGEALGISKLFEHDFSTMSFVKDPPNLTISINTKFEILKNEELSFAIVNGFLRKKVNLLIMMNCNMMNLHCIGALNDSTDYFVAPSTGIDEPGYNYCAIMDFINSSIDIELISKNCIDTLNTSSTCKSNDCKIYRQGLISVPNKWKIFSTSMQPGLINNLIAAINKFSEAIVTKVPERNTFLGASFRNCVNQARSKTVSLTEVGLRYHLYDIHKWNNIMIDHCPQYFPQLFELIKDELLEFKLNLDNIKQDFIVSESNKNSILLSPFCIFFPTKSVFTEIKNFPYINEDTKATPDLLANWLELLKKFFS